jgi:DNA-directed RNA polymerase specialized sigma subunit
MTTTNKVKPANLPTPPKKKRKKRTKRLYFTQVHEDAILEYVKTDSVKVRTELYVKYLGPAFSEMVDKIVFTYKFTTLPNIDELRDECKIWLITILSKYDPNRGSKAFSYFSVITKNWFIHQTKKRSKKRRTEVELSVLSKDLELKHISITNPYDKEREAREFLGLLRKEIDSWEHEDMKPNEEKVLNAIRMLFDEADNIEIFNKKAIYLYMREITGLNTKQVVNSLNSMRVKYRVFRHNWDKGDL